MKKTTTYILLGLSCLCFSSGLLAQTKEERKEIKKSYNQGKLSSLYKKLSQVSKAERQKAYTYAKAHGIPTLIHGKNGKISVLQRISDIGGPIYYTTNNLGAAITTRTTELYTGGSLGLSVEGQNMVMAVWDGGKVRNTHELLTGRVTQMDDATDLDSHATHVSGTLIGGAGPENGEARGMAFQATLLAYDYNNDTPEISEEASNGLLVSNHSYGVNAEFIDDDAYFGYYDFTASTIDEISYDSPYYLMVCSAGNDRGYGYNPDDNGYDLLTGQALAKNNLTVAAVEGVENYTGPNSVVMSSFSSFGPPDDGRIKPDISGKGVAVYSSTADADNSYAFYSGTSMSSPNVAGSLLLLQQLSNNLTGDYLKAATLKALVINGADEAGTAPGPDYEYGWGLLNMEASASILLDNNFSSLYEENKLQQLTTYTKTVTAQWNNETLKATLVWTDPEGNTDYFGEDDATAKLVNDLDIRIEDEDGIIYFPWKLDPANPQAAATQGDNVKDNVEEISIPNASGEYIITITHKGAALENLSQDYSLVVTGIANTEFTFAPDKIEKEVCASEDADFLINFYANENYMGPTEFSVTGLPEEISTSFSNAPSGTEDSFTLTLSNLDQVPEGEYEFTVTGTGGETEVSKDFSLTILNADPIEDTELIEPQNEETNVSVYPLLNWNDVEGATSYTVEVSTQPDFSTLMLSTQVETSELQLTGLEAGTLYYWRVLAATQCYTSNYSDAQFKTIGLGCEDSVFSTDVPVNIPSNQPNQRTASVMVDQDFVIEDLRVNLNITHSYLGDIDIYLTSPEGTNVQLFAQACGDNANINAVFTEGGTVVSCNNGTPTVTGNVKPEESFNAFVGENVMGEWTLTVLDNYPGDGGAINNFGIQACKAEELALQSPKESLSFVLYPNPATNQVTIKSSGLTPMNIGIYDLNGRKVIANNFTTQTPQILDVSSLVSGMYFVKVTTPGKSETQKLIIK